MDARRALIELGEHYGDRKAKYPSEPGAADNWRLGYGWSKSSAALQRHANAFWSGEDFDQESGSMHLIAVAWHAFAMTTRMGDPDLRAVRRPTGGSADQDDRHHPVEHPVPPPHGRATGTLDSLAIRNLVRNLTMKVP